MGRLEVRERISPFYALPLEVRRLIYLTKATWG
jgi:hypothetical protein